MAYLPTDRQVDRQIQDFVDAKTAVQSLLLRELKAHSEESLACIKRIRLGQLM